MKILHYKKPFFTQDSGRSYKRERQEVKTGRERYQLEEPIIKKFSYLLANTDYALKKDFSDKILLDENGVWLKDTSGLKKTNKILDLVIGLINTLIEKERFGDENYLSVAIYNILAITEDTIDHIKQTRDLTIGLLRAETPDYEGFDKRSPNYFIGRYAHVDRISYVRSLLQGLIEQSKEKNPQKFGAIFHIYMQAHDGVRIEADSLGQTELESGLSRGEDPYIRCLYYGELNDKKARLFLNEPRDLLLLLSQKNIVCRSLRDICKFIFNEYVTLAYFLLQENTMHPDTKIYFQFELFCYAKLIEPLVLLRRNILRRNNSSEAKVQFPLLLRRRIDEVFKMFKKPVPKTLDELAGHYNNLFDIETRQISHRKIRGYHVPRARIGFWIYLNLEIRKILGRAEEISKNKRQVLKKLIANLDTFTKDLEKIKSVFLVEYYGQPVLDFKQSCIAIEDLVRRLPFAKIKSQPAKLEAVGELRTAVRSFLHKRTIDIQDSLDKGDFREIAKIIKEIMEYITTFNKELGIKEEIFAKDVRKTGSSPLVARWFTSPMTSLGCRVRTEGRMQYPVYAQQAIIFDRKKIYYSKKIKYLIK